MAELEPTVQTTGPAPAPAPGGAGASPAAETARLLVDYDIYETGLTGRFRARHPFRPADRKRETSELPGVVVQIHAKPGDRVAARDPLYTLDAMKMHNVFRARFGGVVRRLLVAPGDRIAKNHPVLEYE